MFSNGHFTYISGHFISEKKKIHTLLILFCFFFMPCSIFGLLNHMFTMSRYQKNGMSGKYNLRNEIVEENGQGQSYSGYLRKALHDYPKPDGKTPK
ncbi:hypothetical protein AE937_19180 [Bacteroides fragilis]|jgi:hypothetical protein|nr:hypothetical protein [Bacteroides fragilis]